jgi:hypothetical protein
MEQEHNMEQEQNPLPEQELDVVAPELELELEQQLAPLPHWVHTMHELDMVPPELAELFMRFNQISCGPSRRLLWIEFRNID